jgi:hypothetical protein
MLSSLTSLISVSSKVPAFVYNYVISANVNNIDMKAIALANGWNGSVPLTMTVTVNNGIVVGSTSTATHAFDTGATFPAGSSLSLINNGFIVGKGGNGGNGGGAGNSGISSGTNGGPALRARATLSITNNGTVGGGGGGGGGGEYRHVTDSGPVGGGGGGGGAGFGSGGAGGNVGGGAPNGSSGGSGSSTGGGAGGSSGNLQGNVAANGAGGGSLGSSGGNSGQAFGGSGGAAIVGNSNITWVSNGTRLGSIA